MRGVAHNGARDTASRELVPIPVRASFPPDMKERLASEGLQPADAPPELFQTIVKRDVAKWSKVVSEARVSVQ